MLVRELTPKPCLYNSAFMFFHFPCSIEDGGTHLSTRSPACTIIIPLHLVFLKITWNSGLSPAVSFLTWMASMVSPYLQSGQHRQFDSSVTPTYTQLGVLVWHRPGRDIVDVKCLVTAGCSEHRRRTCQGQKICWREQHTLRSYNCTGTKRDQGSFSWVLLTLLQVPNPAPQGLQVEGFPSPL